MLTGEPGVATALRAVGEILEAQGQRYAIIVVGGSALNLHGFVSRTTRDVDVMAFGEPPDGGPFPRIVRPPDPLPGPLLSAVRLVADRLALDEDWLNTVTALQWEQGLPEGFGDRVTWKDYGGLRVGLAGREDLISFKVYAAAEDTGPQSVHYQDLLAMNPSQEELSAAESWVRSQDPSPAFAQALEGVMASARADSSGNR